MERPTPEETQPPLRWSSHAWRALAMLLISAIVWIPLVQAQWQDHRPLFWLDLALGVPAYGLVLLRRRWPMSIAVLITLLGTASGIAAGPGTLATVSLATRRRLWQIVALGAVSLVCAQAFGVIEPLGDDDPYWLLLAVNLTVIAALLGWGMYIGSRRELIWTLRRRAEQAEGEQDERASRAREHERARIAREMHDVLAHRISQISLHAGAMVFREDLTHAEMREGATLIQQSANGALTDLRGVLGVLRDTTTGLLTDPPQPTYADIPRLVTSARGAGMRIEFTDRLERRGELTTTAGRTVYRILQEGLTNAGKHAPGSLVTLEVAGSPDAGIEVAVRNPLGFSGPRTPGSGLGLIGLTERADLSGGWLDHGRAGDTFLLRGWIPWAT